MTPQQAIRHIVVSQYYSEDSLITLTAEQIDDMYEGLVENDLHWDIEYDLREGTEETSITPPSSRNYETKSVAAKTPGGLWVGWTYWYGGGKHGNPEEIDWAKDAYFLDCKEEEKRVVVRTFTKSEGEAS